MRLRLSKQIHCPLPGQETLSRQTSRINVGITLVMQIQRKSAKAATGCELLPASGEELPASEDS